ncbi:hypothetical protein SASPL_126009 [Salvia splendens]|uniref:Uncharacterized protein n=1 Tax=Salvia splendens TaxID=180675 RepID=A0A8X8XJN7_SALSN|nr:hypothetical protein SASPL_126009 [Salvia splendens]
MTSSPFPITVTLKHHRHRRPSPPKHYVSAITTNYFTSFRSSSSFSNNLHRSSPFFKRDSRFHRCCATNSPSEPPPENQIPPSLGSCLSVHQRRILCRFSLLCYSGCPFSSGLAHGIEEIVADQTRALDLGNNSIRLCVVDILIQALALALGLLVTNLGVIKLPRNEQEGASYSALYQFNSPPEIGKKQNSGGPSSQGIYVDSISSNHC